MIEQAIGRRRMTALATLGIALAAVLVAQIILLRPFLLGAEREIVRLNASIDDLDFQVGDLSVQLDTLRRDGEAYEALIASGFVGDQARLVARTALNSATRAADLQRLTFSIQPVVLIEDPRASERGLELQRSLIDITIEAALDSDVYRFLDLVRRDFPGFLSVETFQIDRSEIPRSEMIRAVAAGSPLLTARVTLSWVTLARSSDLDDEDGGS